MTPKPIWPGVGCTTSDLVCTSCTCGVQESGAIGLVVLQYTDILGICFFIFYSVYTRQQCCLHATVVKEF